MAYPDDLLVEGERVIVHERPHPKVLFWPVLAFLAIAGLCSYLAALIRDQSWASWGWLTLAALGLGLVVWLTVVPVARWRTTHFVVTSRRVLVREGVLTRHAINLPLRRIDSVQYRRTVIERMLGCGTLVIDSASEVPLEFDDVPHVYRVHAALCEEAADPAPRRSRAVDETPLLRDAADE